jgi:hypothetical protein
MREVKQDKRFVLQHEGETWTLDVAEWRDDKGDGELRVSRVQATIIPPLLATALQREAKSRGLSKTVLTIEDPPEYS